MDRRSPFVGWPIRCTTTLPFCLHTYRSTCLLSPGHPGALAFIFTRDSGCPVSFQADEAQKADRLPTGVARHLRGSLGLYRRPGEARPGCWASLHILSRPGTALPPGFLLHYPVRACPLGRPSFWSVPSNATIRTSPGKALFSLFLWVTDWTKSATPVPVSAICVCLIQLDAYLCCPPHPHHPPLRACLCRSGDMQALSNLACFRPEPIRRPSPAYCLRAQCQCRDTRLDWPPQQRTSSRSVALFLFLLTLLPLAKSCTCISLQSPIFLPLSISYWRKGGGHGEDLVCMKNEQNKPRCPRHPLLALGFLSSSLFPRGRQAGRRGRFLNYYH